MKLKLNIDCLIDVLFAAEERTGLHHYWDVHYETGEGLNIFTQQEVYYHVQQAIKAGLLESEAEFLDGTIEISDLTMRGHLALNSVRNPAVRKKAKSEWPSRVLSGIADATISGFFSLAAEIAKSGLLS